MSRYIENYLPPPPRVDYVKKLLDKWRGRPIGQFANNVLRRLLELGVAEDWEVEEFQKANGQIQINRLKIPFGAHVNENFGIAFPLLITEEHLKYDIGNNFYTQPLSIDGTKYWLCSQWTANHREKMEEWIRKSLPRWFKRADEDSRNEMIHWIENF